MLTFYLYRLKIERAKEESLFDDKARNPGEIILSAIEELPREVRKGQTWRIGNLQKVPNNAIFFALGRITQTTHPLYDEEKKDFIEEQFEEAPHTYVVIDLEYQVCAIAQRTKTAPTVRSIASNLQKLLNSSSSSELEHLIFTLSIINDPERFIDLLRKAIRITSFKITFSPPNPFDVEKQFHLPMEELLKATAGSKGETSIKGEDLDANILEDLARSAAATGNDATASIKPRINAKTETKYLKGNQVTISVDEISTVSEIESLAEKIREAYKNVRKADEPL